MNWEPAFKSSFYYNFLLDNPESKNYFTGSVIPGKDKSGRQYPFILLVKFEKASLYNQQFLFPLILTSASNEILLIQNLIENYSGIAEINKQIDTLEFNSPDEYKKEYLQYLNSTLLHHFFERVLETQESSERKKVINNLFFISSLISKNAAGSSRSLTIKFPLFPGEPFYSFDAAFWIEFFFCLIFKSYTGINKPLTSKLPVSLFWSLPGHEKANSLFIIFGKLSPQSFTDLISPGNSNNSIDLKTYNNGEELNLPSEYEHLLIKEDLRLSEFLESI
jgi:hypothetical protein